MDGCLGGRMGRWAEGRKKAVQWGKAKMSSKALIHIWYFMFPFQVCILSLPTVLLHQSKLRWSQSLGRLLAHRFGFELHNYWFALGEEWACALITTVPNAQSHQVRRPNTDYKPQPRYGIPVSNQIILSMGKNTLGFHIISPVTFSYLNFFFF